MGELTSCFSLWFVWWEDADDDVVQMKARQRGKNTQKCELSMVLKVPTGRHSNKVGLDLGQRRVPRAGLVLNKTAAREASMMMMICRDGPHLIDQHAQSSVIW